jgi:epoxyqueuosine reductase
MVTELGEHLAALLISEGFPTVFPTTDKRFKMLAPYASNWSERHVAYVCGLGTFGLSKGLITEKGIAGRFGSVITTCPLTPTERPYSNPFEYCTMCGKCQTNCPAGAIDRTKGITHGKEHSTCNLFLNKLSLPPHGSNQRSRYGCGKCQVNVPCENGIPHGKSHYHD